VTRCLLSDPATCLSMQLQPDVIFFFSSRRRHTRSKRDWSSDVCSSDLDITQLHPRTRQMVQTAASVEWTVVASKVEALALEYTRSEERRVGKEWRSQWTAGEGKERRESRGRRRRAESMRRGTEWTCKHT